MGKKVEAETMHHGALQREHLIERAASTLSWWAAQAAAIEEDRKKIQKILPLGAVAALATCHFSYGWAAAILGVATLAWGQGLYLVTVHRWEYAHNVVEARKDLWLAQKSFQEAMAQDVASERRHVPSGARWLAKRARPDEHCPS